MALSVSGEAIAWRRSRSPSALSCFRAFVCAVAEGWSRSVSPQATPADPDFRRGDSGSQPRPSAASLRSA